MRYRPATLAVMATLSTVLVLNTPTASAAPACSASTCTVRFTLTGHPESFTVPAGVTELTAWVAGASGGTGFDYGAFGSSRGIPGSGGSVSAQVPVTPGETLTVVVGGHGTAYNAIGPGGYGGGGPSTRQAFGATGGGGSFLFRGPAILVAAGGGGGAGGMELEASGDPGGAGGSGGNGSDAFSGGGGATTTTPGAGCPAGTGPARGPATFGIGGATSSGGGAGGGGVYGGGSSCSTSFGGGGGSGLLAPGVTVIHRDTNNGDGLVQLSWPAPIKTTTTVAATPATAGPGGRVVLTAHVTPAPNSTPTGSVTFRSGTLALGTVPLTSAGIATLTTTAPHAPGTEPITASYGGAGRYQPSTSTTVLLTITERAPPLPPASPAATPAGAQLANTGKPAVTLLAAAALTLIFGAAITVIARRRPH